MMDECRVLTDVSTDQWLDQFESQWGPFQISKRTLRGGAREGVDVLSIRFGGFEASIVPTRGMSLHQAHIDSQTPAAPTSAHYGWDSPVAGPVHPHWVPVSEPSGLGWLEGFDELLVRCGLSSNGAPQFDDHGRLVFPLHGRIGNLPASRVELHYDHQLEQLKVLGTIRETRFHFSKWKLEVEYVFDAKTHSIEVIDRVTNIGGSEQAFQMLYHYNLGKDLLQEGGEIRVPADEVIPRNPHSASQIESWSQIEPPLAGFAETVYFIRPRADHEGRSMALLVNRELNQAAAIRFQVATLPCFSLWKNFAAREDGYVIGLEPGTNFPNTRAFEEQHGRVTPLQPGESSELKLELVFANSAESVEALARECSSLQSESPPTLAETPHPDFCE